MSSGAVYPAALPIVWLSQGQTIKRGRAIGSLGARTRYLRGVTS
jgi:hypothetical protein